MTHDALEWRRALRSVRAMVDGSDEIVCTPERLAIPPSSREGFYRLVSEIQEGLVEEAAGSDLARSESLAARCRAVKKRIEDASGLSELALPASVGHYIESPRRALEKTLFCCVMDCLQTGEDQRALYRNACGALDRAHASLARYAYEFWTYFGVVAALDPVRFWLVESPDTVQTFATPAERIVVGHQVTSPERRIPDAVFETKSGRLFAFKNEPARELDFYGLRIRRRRDMSLGGNSADQLAHRVLMLYELESIASIPLLADRDKLMIRPVDLMVEVLSQKEMAKPSFASHVASRYRAVPSRRSVCVVALEEGASFPAEFEADLTLPARDLVFVGSEERRLEDIARLLDDAALQVERPA